MVKGGSLVYVRYRDHVLFRNVDSSLYGPVEREAVGWLAKENEEAVWIFWERSAKQLPHERTQHKESGLVILKSDIIEMRKIG